MKVATVLLVVACFSVAGVAAQGIAPDPPANLQNPLFFFSKGIIYQVAKDKTISAFLDAGYPSATGFAANSNYLFWAINNGTIYYSSKSFPTVNVFIESAYANAGLWADSSYLYFPTTTDMRRASIISRTVSTIQSAPESAHFTTFGKYLNTLVSCATPKNSVSNNEIWKIDLISNAVSSLVNNSYAYNCYDLAVDGSTGIAWWKATQSNANLCWAGPSGNDDSGCINFYSSAANLYPQVVASGSILYLIAGTTTIIEAKAVSASAITQLNTVTFSQGIYNVAV